MTFKSLRNSLNMSQTRFCEEFGNIPVSTYQHWEQGINKPPRYVSNLILDKYNQMMKERGTKNEETRN